MAGSPFTTAFRAALGDLSGPVSGSDGELLERFVSHHDQAAFTAIVHRHGPMVLRLCRRMLANPADVDDAFQAVFLVLVRRAGTIIKRPSLASWLHGVARSIAVEAQRSEGRRRAREQQLGSIAEEVPCREQGPIAADDLRPILDEELGRLPERYRAPLVLCYLEGRTVDEAATDLGVARGTVASRMSRGRDLLRNHMARRGLALSAAALTAQLESTATAAIPVATLHALVSVGFVSGTGIREGAAILAKEALQAMFWSKLRWGGIFLACLLMLGTATVKWTGTSGKPAANANVSGEQGDDFYVRWRFDTGPPKDIKKLGGEWQWVPRGGKAAMVSRSGVVLLLPTRIPKRPFVLSVKLAGFVAPEGTARVGAVWIDGNKACAHGQWMGRKVGWKCTQPVFIYFAGRWALVSIGTLNGGRQFIHARDYRIPYPGQRVGLNITNLAIEEVELRGLPPGEFPMELRHMEQTVKTMRLGSEFVDQPLPSLK